MLRIVRKLTTETASQSPAAKARIPVSKASCPEVGAPLVSLVFEFSNNHLPSFSGPESLGRGFQSRFEFKRFFSEGALAEAFKPDLNSNVFFPRAYKNSKRVEFKRC